MESTLSIYISSLAAFIAFLSLVFSVKSWRESNRPIVTALIRCPISAELATALELVVSNSGNQPATEVRLHISEKELSNALTAPTEDRVRKAVERCFSPDTFIPVLEPGKEMTNSFGYFTTDEKPDTWKYKSVLEVTIKYEGLTGRKYSNKNKLWIVCNKGFALSYHEES